LDWSVAMGALFLTKSAIFPGRWFPLHHEKFQLVAMAGIGNIPGILGGECPARLAEISCVRSAHEGLAEIVYFVLIIARSSCRAL